MSGDDVTPRLLAANDVDRFVQFADDLLNINARDPLAGMEEHALLHGCKGTGVDAAREGSSRVMDHSANTVIQ